MSSALWWVMNGRAAAPPACPSRTGVSTSWKAAVDQHAADGIDHRRADRERLARLLPERQIQVPPAVASLGIGEPVADAGKGAQALGQQLEARQAHRQLAVVGAHNRSPHADPVAEVEVGEVAQRLLADLITGDHQLDRSGLVAQLGKDQPAVAALGHQPPRQPHHILGHGARRQLAVGASDRCGGAVTVKADRIRLDPSRS